MAFCESGASVRSVVVDGRVILHEGRIEAFDEQAILQEAAEATAGRPFRGPMPPEVVDAIARFTAFQQDILKKEWKRARP